MGRPGPRRGRGARLLAGCAGMAAVGLVVFALALVGSWLYLRTEAGNELIRQQLEALLQDAAPNGEVTIGRLRTDLFRRLEVYEVRIDDLDGNTVVYVERALADVSLGAITRRVIRLPELRIDGMLLDLEERPDGILNLAYIFGQVVADPDAPWEGLPIYLDLPSVDIRGMHVRYSTTAGEIVRLTGVDALASVTGQERIDIDELWLVGLLAEPGPVAVRATGALTYTGEGVLMRDLRLRPPRSEIGVSGPMEDRWDLALAVERLHLPDIDPIVGDAGLGGTLSGRVDLVGPGDRPQVRGTLRGIDGTVGEIGLDLALGFADDPLTVAGRLDLGDVHVHHLYPELGDVVIVRGAAELGLVAGAWPEGLVLDVRFRGGRQVAFGQELDALAGHFRIEGGVLTLADTQAVGIVGELDVAGRIDLVAGPMDLRISGTAEPGRLAALGVEGLGTTGWLNVRVRGNVFQLEAPIRVDGTAAWAPFRFDGGQVALGALRAAFDARVTPARVTGVAQATLGSGEVYGVAVDAADVRDLQFVVPLDPPGTVTLQGALDAAGVELPEVFRAERTWGDFAVRVPQVAPPEVRVGVEVGAHELLGFPGTYGQVQATVQGDDVAYRLDLFQEDRQMLLADGTFHLGTQQVVLGELMISLTPRATWEAVRTVQFRLIDDGIAEADIALAGNLGAIELLGTVRQTGPVDADVTVVDLQLDVFAEMFPEQVAGLSGVLNLRARLTGTGQDPVLDAALDVRGLWVEDAVRALDVEGTLAAGGGTLRPDLWVGVADRPIAVVQGVVPVSLDVSDPRVLAEGPLDLQMAIVPGQLERFELAFPAIEPGTLPVGGISANLHATGTPREPELHLAGVSEMPVDNWLEPARVEFELRREAGEVTFWSDLREGMQPRATITGTGATRADEAFAWLFEDAPEPDLEDLELWLDDLLVHVVLLGMPARSVAVAAGADLAVGGEILGGLTITGSPYRPEAEGGFHWIEGSIGDVPLEGALLSVVPADRGYLVDLRVDFEGEGLLQATGAVPIDIDLQRDLAEWTAGPLDVGIGGTLPLQILAALDPGVRNAVGVVDVSGEIGGTIADPLPVVTATLSDGSLIYSPLALRVTQIELDLSANQRQVTLTRFRARTEPLRRAAMAAGMLEIDRQPSAIQAAGTARLEEWAPTAVSGRVRLEHGAWVSATQEAQLRVDGELLLSGAWPALNVGGRLDLRRGVMNFDAATFLTAAPLVPDPRMRIVRPGVEQVPRPPPEPPFYQDFNVNVMLNLGRNLTLDMGLPLVEDLGALGATVTRADVTARLGSEDLALSLVEGEPSLLGEVDVIDGRVRILRSRMDLQASRIVFAGGPIDDPVLDLHARMTLPEGTVDLYVRGTVQAPEPTFASEEYPDQSQILAILLTGRAPEQLSQEEAEGTAQALAGLLLDSLFAGQALGGLSIGADGSVEIGVPVGSTLYTTTSIRPAAGIVDNRITFEVEWTIAPRLLLNVGVGDLRQWGDLYWEYRF